MTPFIEYHFNVFHHGTWGVHCESHPVGTTFAAVIANGWAWAEAVVPTRLRWASWVWPGGYEIHYAVRDGGVLCHKCANAELDRTLDKDDEQFFVVGQDINYEDQLLYCDHCHTHIEPECGFDEAEDDQAQPTQSPA